MPVDAAWLVSQIEVARNEAADARARLRAEYSELPVDDVRISMPRHIRATLSSCYLQAICLDSHLVEPRWWMSQFPAMPPRDAIEEEIHDFGTLLAASLILMPFALFESGLRLIVRAIDPNACGGGTAEFMSIYSWLLIRLAKAGELDAAEPIEFLNVYRLMRNTQHNNGIFRSPRGDQTLVWEEIEYAFVDGQAPAFQDWAFDIRLVRRLVALSEEILLTRTVRAL